MAITPSDDFKITIITCLKILLLYFNPIICTIGKSYDHECPYVVCITRYLES